MNFIQQQPNKQENWGTYMLTIAVLLLSLVIGSTVANTISVQFFGFSLAYIPENTDLNVILTLMLLPFGFMLGALLLSVKYFHKRQVRTLFTVRNEFDWKRFFFSFLLWGGVMTLFLLFNLFSGSAIEWNFEFSAFFPLLLISIFLMPIQTIAEEAIFRGYLLQAFGRLFGKAWVSILLSGVLFGLLHWANPEVTKIGDVLLIFYILTGVFLGIITQLDGGMELSIGYHTVNNVFAALIVTNDWQAFQTNALFVDHSPPSFGLESILTLLVLQPLLIVIFAKRYRWKNGWNKIFN